MNLSVDAVTEMFKDNNARVASALSSKESIKVHQMEEMILRSQDYLDGQFKEYMQPMPTGSPFILYHGLAFFANAMCLVAYDWCMECDIHYHLCSCEVPRFRFTWECPCNKRFTLCECSKEVLTEYLVDGSVQAFLLRREIINGIDPLPPLH